MSHSNKSWLEMREPIDRQARSDELSELFARSLGSDPVLVDLGCGTGANYRYLSAFLPAGQSWHCADVDGEALALAKSRPIAHPVIFEELDLAGQFPDVPKTAVTMSALLDLGSSRWLDDLSRYCSEVPLLVAMSTFGDMTWGPTEPEDELIHCVLQKRQRSDRGLGAALGNEAVGYLELKMKTLGHRVVTANSNWVLAAGHSDILALMLAGIGRAVEEVAMEDELDSWFAKRLRQHADQKLSISVGHADLLALPSA